MSSIPNAKMKHAHVHHDEPTTADDQHGETAGQESIAGRAKELAGEALDAVKERPGTAAAIGAAVLAGAAALVGGPAIAKAVKGEKKPAANKTPTKKTAAAKKTTTPKKSPAKSAS